MKQKRRKTMQNRDNKEKQRKPKECTENKGAHRKQGTHWK